VGLSVATLAIVAMQDVLLEAVWNGLDEIRATFGLGPAGT
jgi:hypothetical protein